MIPITVILLSNMFFIFSAYYLGAYIDRWNLSGVSILFPALIHLLLAVEGLLLQLMNIKNWNIEPWRTETNLSVVLAKACNP